MPNRIKSLVAAFCVIAATSSALADEGGDGLADLFNALREAEGDVALQIEQRIWEEWSQSGSEAMDFLLERGRSALEAGDTTLAIEHFTALIDHAPEFAEGYNARATAFFQAGKYGPSLADIRQVLRLNPRHFGALQGLALILEELGEEEGALMAYRAVEEIYPAREGVSEAIGRLERRVDGQDI